MCVCFCLCLCLPVLMCVCTCCLCVCLSVCIHACDTEWSHGADVPLRSCLTHCRHLSVCLFVALSVVCACLCVCVCTYLCVYICLSMSICSCLCLSVADVSYTRPMRSSASDDDNQGTLSMFQHFNLFLSLYH